MTQLEALQTILRAARHLDDDAPFRPEKELFNQEKLRQEWRNEITAICQFAMTWQHRIAQGV